MESAMTSGVNWIRLSLVFIAVLTVVLVTGGRRMASVAEAERGPIPAPAVDENAQGKHSETAVFAGGCFWGVQTVFQRVKGVTATTAGYSGGSAATATYDQVSSEGTGHAESVKIVFDPSR